MIPALSQVCTLQASFEEDIADYAAGQCFTIEVWLTKLENFLASHTREQILELWQEHGVRCPVASFQGGLLVSQGDARAAAWSLFTDRLHLCRDLGIGTLVVSCDISGPLTAQTVDRAQASLAQAASAAEQAGTRLALEFRAESSLGNNLQTAIALVDEVDNPYLGICLDAFHYFIGPSKMEDLGGLHQGNLFHVQLCDLADTPRELAADANRILPGEGDIRLESIVARLREIDYRGCVSVELMNPQIWQVPPRQFGEIAMTALRKVLGQARMD